MKSRQLNGALSQFFLQRLFLILRISLQICFLHLSGLTLLRLMLQSCESALDLPSPALKAAQHEPRQERRSRPRQAA